MAEPAWVKTAQRLNTVCPYFTMFPLDFPLRILRQADVGDRVLDPFCGRGTTLFAARQVGLGAVGIDINPVAAAIAEAKVAPARAHAVSALAAELLTNGYRPQQIPAGSFWELAYHRSTLVDICRLREQLADRTGGAASMLRAIVLGILHGPLHKGPPTYLSNQMPRTYATKPGAAVKFWQVRNMTPPDVPVLDTLLRRIDYSLCLIPPAMVRSEVYLGDARDVLLRLRRRFDWVITSPPYYGMYTYVPDQWLRNWFLGGPDSVVYDAQQQVSRGGLAGFVTGLADVWRAVAKRCTPAARMFVRFGSLPGSLVDPEEVLRASLEQADAGWAVESVRGAGLPAKRARQAIQFTGAGEYATEIDCQIGRSGARSVRPAAAGSRPLPAAQRSGSRATSARDVTASDDRGGGCRHESAHGAVGRITL